MFLHSWSITKNHEALHAIIYCIHLQLTMGYICRNPGRTVLNRAVGKSGGQRLYYIHFLFTRCLLFSPGGKEAQETILIAGVDVCKPLILPNMFLFKDNLGKILEAI